MWALRQSAEQWTDADKDGLVCLCEPSPDWQMADELGHAFTSLFATQLSNRQGKRQLWPWMHKVRASQ
jgi:hypothetical protein